MGRNDRLDERLGRDNFESWDRMMRCLLLDKGLITARSLNVAEALESYPEKDANVYAQLMLNVEPQYHLTIQVAGGGESAYKALQEKFQQKNAAQRMLLLGQLHELEMKPREEVLELVSRAKILQARLISAGHEVL